MADLPLDEALKQAKILRENLVSKGLEPQSESLFANFRKGKVHISDLNRDNIGVDIKGNPRIFDPYYRFYK